MRFFDRKEKERGSEKAPSPWITCKFCGEISLRGEVSKRMEVCPKCNYHFPIPPKKWISILADEGSFAELDGNLKPVDFLNFRDVKSYRERLERALEKSGSEAFVSGRCTLGGFHVFLGVMDFSFMGGSLSSVVGEKVARLFERATEEKLPVVVVTSSGGARMQEGIISLMQMAKTSCAVCFFKKVGKPYISILSDPTLGGVSASYALQADVVIAEPKALIGFAGPRVIKETIGKELPSGFQRAEFLLEHGMVDMVVPRWEIKEKLVKILDLLQ